jgi:hypothetical protein
MVSIFPHMYNVISRLATCPPAPILEVLELFHYEDEDEFDIFQPEHLKRPLVLFHGHAPALKVCTLWGVHIAWDTHFLRDLLELELAYHAKDVRPSWDEFARIIRNSPNLQILNMQLSGPACESQDWPLEPLPIPTLEQLYLAYHPPEYASSLIRSLVLRNLTFLVLEFDDADYSSFVRQIASQPTPKSPSMLAGLTHLKISSLPCDEKSCDIMYEQLTNLKAISLNCACIEDFFFEKLMRPIPTEGNAIRNYCPNLETITVTGINGELLRGLVVLRKVGSKPIKQIFASVHDAPIINRVDEQWLKENVERFEYFDPSDSDDDSDEDDEDSDDDHDEDDGDSDDDSDEDDEDSDEDSDEDDSDWDYDDFEVQLAIDMNEGIDN